ncbi:hypothetical protein [Streptomyces chartreusis]|uniref:hypothetical protein n=1 Tax=Streptomyces chartreusis TaxID=1969 RepID=UPI003650FE6A
MKLTRDGDAFIARLTPSQVSAMYEALSYLRHRDFDDTALTLLVGARRDGGDAVLERLVGPHTESRDFRFATQELHTVHSALTAAPTMFLVRDGAFLQEPFHIRLGFYRENLDALTHAIMQAATEG